MFSHPGALLALLLGGVAVDVVCGLTWWPDYFRIGIPLFVRRQAYAVAVPILPGSKVLYEHFSGSWAIPLAFRQLSPNEIAVRESYWSGFFRFTYTPLVHGLLEIDELSREFRVIGRMNFLPLLLIAAFAGPIAIQHDFPALPGIVLVSLLVATPILLIQFVRYGNVVREAVRIMEENLESRA